MTASAHPLDADPIVAEYATLRVRRDSAVVNVTFDNPPVNALSADVMREVRTLLLGVRDDESIAVIVFDSANPEFFIAHVDMHLGDQMDQLDRLAAQAPAGVNVFQAVERTARRIGELPPGVARAAKRVIPATTPLAGYEREETEWSALIGRPETERIMRESLERGAQTVDGERDLEDLLRRVARG